MFTREQIIANSKQRNKDALREVCNAAGFQIDINTLTSISQRVTEQKFYDIKVSDYIPVEVGNHAYADEILTYQSFDVGTSFEKCLIDPTSNRGTLEKFDTQINSVKTPTKYFGAEITYNLLELSSASASAGNWSLIEAKERSRYTAWRQGIQRTAFLGLASNANIEGLLSLSSVASNLTAITTPFKDMTPAQFETAMGSALPAAFNNSNSTTVPDKLVIGMSDMLGMGTTFDETHKNVSRIQRLRESLREASSNPNFQVLGSAYCDAANNDLGVTRYVMYSSNPDTLSMQIPVDYTPTVQDTINGFYYNSVAYGQFTGVQALRPREIIYFDF